MMNKQNMMIGIGIAALGVAAHAGRAAAAVSYATYAGFVSHDVGQRSLCLTAGPQIAQGLQVVLQPCDATSPTVYTTALDQLQINLTPGQSSTYVCLDDVVQQVADVGLVHTIVWNTCGPNVAPNQIPSQAWNFRGGLISNDGTGICLAQEGAGLPAVASACTPVDRPASPGVSRYANLWMPIYNEMQLTSVVQPGDCLTNLRTNYNSNTDDTQYTPCDGRAHQVWIARFLPDFSSYVFGDPSGGKALDVYGAQIQLDAQGLPEGVVDMADPNGTAAQFWFFSSLGNGSQTGYSLLVNGLTAGQHMCLNMLGQNPANANILFGCNTVWGHGDDPADQVQATLPGFTH
jgi:hypothetical protein